MRTKLLSGAALALVLTMPAMANESNIDQEVASQVAVVDQTGV